MSINLEKGGRVNLDKASPGLQRVRMGLGWEPAAAPQRGLLGRLFGSSSPQAIDLDASCLAYSGERLVDECWFQNLTAMQGALRHSGDNLTGEGDGDDESITVELGQVAKQADSLVFTVHSFRGQQFSAVRGAFCRLVDEATGREIARFELSTQQGALASSTAMLMAVLQLRNGSWELRAVGEAMQGKTFNDNRRDILQQLKG